MKLIILCLTVLFSVGAQAKNSFPGIEDMAQKQAVRNLIQNGDLSMIYENMKAGNWSVAEAQLETYQNRLKDKENYPQEPSAEDVNWLVSAFDREISKGMGHVKEKELQEKKTAATTEEATGDGSVVKQKLEAYEAKYKDISTTSYASKITAEQLDTLVKDLKDYQYMASLSPRYRGNNDIAGDEFFMSQIWKPAQFESYADGSKVEITSNSLAKLEKDRKFANQTYAKFYELLTAAVPKLIANNQAAAKKADEDYEHEQAAANARAKEEDRLAGIKNNTKECKAAKAKRNYCNAMMVKGGMERTIANETEIGKETGFVNARKLHGAGSTKIYMDQQSKKASAEYSSITGKTINRSICGINENQISAQIEKDVERLCGTID